MIKGLGKKNNALQNSHKNGSKCSYSEVLNATTHNRNLGRGFLKRNKQLCANLENDDLLIYY